VTRPGFRLGEPFPQPAPPPVLGQDTARWLAALGYTEAEIEALRTSGVTEASKAKNRASD
jgi:crotonobetainyl-CoA:carnitine CoA-transferase CaiB-like acyl-CoA transferase